ncbi:replication protein A 70 kDa DNA-binding subunit-like isoform X2 [Drosophila subpulchrella]|uniref:replication protein A 70 kDa DNA-binding subunit-like isoform X2 n=1 Tax=Drosophila subpulchrella TaxID=1486046 RepID=UPI0018A15947|nr:replication protein A 70 kDa DNA-binding subunit-like isoform X2 [Drosophila subpulchrella]
MVAEKLPSHYLTIMREADTDLKILPNPLQIYFLDSTVLQQSTQNIQIPIIRNTFLPLSEVSKIPDREPVDTIGICTEVRDVDERGGYYIREILLVDEELQPVMLNLWEKAARLFQGEVDDVILLKGARAQSNNNEIKLNASWYTNVQINPDIPEAISLRDWYENQ